MGALPKPERTSAHKPKRCAIRANPKTPHKIADAGVSLSWLDSLIDLGTQTLDYQGQVKKQRKLRFTWELCGTQVSDEDQRPVTIYQDITWSFHDKAKLRSIVKSWAGEEPTDSFDLESLYKIPCQLNVIHKVSGGNTYANVGTIMPLPKGTKVEPRVNDPFTFDLNDQRCDALEFLKCPEYLRAKIMKSPEGMAKFGEGATGTPDIINYSNNDPNPSDIPF